MWMWRNVHAAGAAKVVGAIVVGKTPRTDQRPLPLRKCATNVDRARAAQRHLPRPQHFEAFET
jgi:hypothetical protein